jgi:hypothetical protein
MVPIPQQALNFSRRPVFELPFGVGQIEKEQADNATPDGFVALHE